MEIKGFLLLHESGGKYIHPEDPFFGKGILILKDGKITDDFFKLDKGIYVVHDLYDKGILVPPIRILLKDLSGYKLHNGKFSDGDKCILLEII